MGYEIIFVTNPENYNKDIKHIEILKEYEDKKLRDTIERYNNLLERYNETKEEMLSARWIAKDLSLYTGEVINKVLDRMSKMQESMREELVVQYLQIKDRIKELYAI